LVEPVFAPEGQPESSPALQCRVRRFKEDPSRRDGGKPAGGRGKGPCRVVPCAPWGRGVPAALSQRPNGTQTVFKGPFEVKGPLQGLKSLATLRRPLRGKEGSPHADLRKNMGKAKYFSAGWALTAGHVPSGRWEGARHTAKPILNSYPADKNARAAPRAVRRTIGALGTPKCSANSSPVFSFFVALARGVWLLGVDPS